MLNRRGFSGAQMRFAIATLCLGGIGFVGRDRMTVAFEVENGAGKGVATVTHPAQTQTAAPVAQPVDTSALMQQVTQTVQTAITAALAPVTQSVAATNSRIDALAKPQSQSGHTPQYLFQGLAPGQRTGEDPLSSRGYSFSRLLAARQNFAYADQAKEEINISNRLYQYYRQNGFVSEAQSFLAPMSVDMLPDDIGADFQKEIRQMMRAGLEGANNDDIRAIAQRAALDGMQRQALSIYDDTGLGVLLGPTSQGELIPLLRNRELFSNAGATQMTLPPNGRMSWPRQTGATTAYWVGEKQTITESEPTTGDIEMMAKKLAALVKMPNELIAFASGSVEAFIRMDLARVMGLKADSTMLDGVGTAKSPKGLLRYPGIETVVATTTGADGDTFSAEDPSRMIAELEENNHDPEGDGAVFVMRPKQWNYLRNKRSDSVTAADGKGPFLFNVNRADITAGKPGAVDGLRVLRTMQMPNNRTKGNGTALGAVLLGIFRHWMIGRIGVMEFANSVQGDTPFVTDQTWVRVIQHLDAAPRYEDAFCLCDDLLLTA